MLVELEELLHYTIVLINERKNPVQIWQTFTIVMTNLYTICNILTLQVSIL